MDLSKLLRPNIAQLVPYSSARSEFTGKASVWLDANENPFNEPYCRYPDPLQRALKAKIAEIKHVDAESIFLGVGSDECIDIMYRVFCRPGIDNVVAIAPTYGMYEVCANINDVEYRTVPLGEDFSLDVQALLAAADENTKVMWICSPNNPTGNAFPLSQIAEIAEKFEGMLVVDEAYIDFSSQPSALTLHAPNIVVMHTLSKAWGSAAIRLGMAFAEKEIIDVFNKVKYPYNINILTQKFAMERVSNQAEVAQWVQTLLENRSWLIDQLQTIGEVKHIYPTDANFVLVKVGDANALYDFLRQEGIIVRNRTRVTLCEGCLRITIGTEEENAQLINAIRRYEAR